MNGLTAVLRNATLTGGLLALALAATGCPGPQKPPVEPDPGLGGIDMDPEPVEPEPEGPPPEAGVVSLGPAMMTGGAGMSDDARGVAKRGFLATFDQNRHLLRRCYAEGLERNPELAGSMDLEVVINADGSVYEVNLPSVELEDPAMVRCVKRAFEELPYEALRDGEMFSVTPVVKFKPE